MSEEKEIDEFLNRFDEIKDTFGKTSELKIPNDINSATPQDLDSKISGTRMERHLRTKEKTGLSSAKERLSSAYLSKINDGDDKNIKGGEGYTDTKEDKEAAFDTIFANNIPNNNEKVMRNKNEVIMKSSSKRKTRESSNGGSSRKKKILKGILIALLALAVIGIIFLVTIIITAEPINSENVYDRLSENSIMYDDEGNVIDNIVSLDGLRTNVSYTDLPKNLTDAIVCIEDKTFWEHNGFNFIRIAGAIKESIFDGGSISGTSTITQQLARNIYLAEQKSVHTMDRKLKEAYYTILLEKHLSKEQILEAYLNTIALGFNTNGVQAASQAYFSKNVSDLALAECATLAALPQAPSRTSPIQTVAVDQIEASNPDILFKNDEWSYVYSDKYIDRKNLVLLFMKEQGKISDAEYAEALGYDMRASIKPGDDVTREVTSYFADFVIDEVVKDLMESLKYSEEEARKKVYSGGLRIHTSMNSNMQNIVEAEFVKNSNFPRVVNLRKDSAGSLLDSKGNVMLYSFNNYFNSDGSFTLTPEEFRVNSDGSIVIYKGKRLNIFQTTVQGAADVSIEFKDMYVQESGTFYGIKGGFILIDQKYKTLDSEGNVVISPQLNLDSPNFLQAGDNGLVIASDKYSLRQKTVQPQGSMVIIDYKNGEIKAMAGGRGLEGRLLYNRSVKPRQPGSSMKPIGAYGPALQASVDQLNGGPQAVTDKSQVYGNFWTAASSINDAPIKLPNGNLWPKNWNNAYGGMMRMRYAIEQSINTCAVKVFNDIGTERAVKFAKSLGVTSIVETGAVSDMNPSAMALGGMTYGISPLEMAGAYGAFANAGTYVTPSSYVKVTNKKGETILEPKHESTQVMDKGVAFVMTDMLRSAVNAKSAGNATMSNQPVAGKTGTTTDNYDAWFVGYTPQYVGSVWIGNDINIELSQGSIAATTLWARIMRQIHANIPTGKFIKPDNVISVNVDSFNGYLPSSGSVSEYFVKGTQPTSRFRGSYPSGAGSPKFEQPTPDDLAPPTDNTSPAITPPTTPGSGSGNDILPPPIVDSGGTGTPPTDNTVPPVTTPTPDEVPSWIN